MAEPPRLAVEQVSHAYDGRTVLDRVGFAMPAGEILCLLGPSGCGKTTLLRLVAGLEPLQRGAIAIDGRRVAGDGDEVPPERRNVGMVFQDFALFPHLSALDNVGFGVAGADRRAIAAGLLARLGMAEHAESFPHMLSGGQQQRVALARALAPRPLLMLLDEPFSGIDMRLRGHLRDETLHLLKASAVATLMVTHDPEEAMFMGDRIAVMSRGRILQVGAPAELYRKPTSVFVAGFFGEINRLPATVAGGAAPSPFGPVPAPGFRDGAAVEILIRPEMLVFDDAGAAGVVRARIETARMLGRTWLMHLQVGDGPGALHLHARVRGNVTPAEGSEVGLRLIADAAILLPAGTEE